MKEPWNIDRRKELQLLMNLLITVDNINNGSDFIGKLEKSIYIAQLLNNTDISITQKSFIQFLTDEAAGEIHDTI